MKQIGAALVLLLGACSSAADTPTPTQSPNSSVPTISSSPTSRTSSSQHPVIEGFELAAELPSEFGYAFNLVAWSGGFVAVGGPGLLVSPDGYSWEIVEPSVPDSTFIGRIIPTADGRLIGFGLTGPTGEHPDQFTSLISSDARTWEVIDLGFSPSFYVSGAAVGPRGMVIAGRENIGSEAHAVLLISSDGLTWKRTYDQPRNKSIEAIGAGPQGFVAVGQHGYVTNDGRGLVLASSDGTSWIEAPSDDGPLREVPSLWSIEPIGGDWITAPMPTTAGAMVVHSADGLSWRTATTLQLTCYLEGLTTSRLAGDGTRVFLRVAVAGDCEATPTSLWVSTDGQSWRPMEIDVSHGDIAVASRDGTTVLLAVADVQAPHTQVWVDDAP